jgi:AcrR family transcriptional regulator
MPPTRKSPLRAAQASATRERIVAAAGEVFALRGFEGARIEDIAATAGVAYPTVYKAFASKRDLLATAVEVVMTGGAEGAVERQSWWQEQLDEPDPARQLRLAARNARRIYDRAGRLLEVVRAAAPSDREIAALWRRVADERLARSRTTAKSLAGKAPLRASTPATARTLWSLSGPELYVLHVDGAGVSSAAYQRWLADLLVAAVLAP